MNYTVNKNDGEGGNVYKHPVTMWIVSVQP
jgi:hypothetical protein